MRHLLHHFDRYFTQRIQAWPPSIRPLMKIASFVGYPFVTLGIIATGFLVLSWWSQDARLLYASAAIFITHGVGSLMKLIIGRPRPASYTYKLWHMRTHSFPSGHALGSAAAYGTIALAIAQVNVIVSIILTGLVALIGVSRIYLGAHYPSDVIAGWLLGIASAFIAASFIV